MNFLFAGEQPIDVVDRACADKFQRRSRSRFPPEARMRKVVMEGGFSRFRRATETPFNLIYAARP